MTWKQLTEKAKSDGLVDCVDEKTDWFKKPIEIIDKEVVYMKTPVINSLKACQDVTELNSTL